MNFGSVAAELLNVFELIYYLHIIFFKQFLESILGVLGHLFDSDLL